MKVLLQQRVPSLGQVGQVVEVSESYARNFLIPKKLALPATADVIKKQERATSVKAKQVADEQVRDAAAIAEIQAVHPMITASASPNGKLFAAIQEKDIRSNLAQRHQLQLSPSTKISGLPLKHTGDHQLTITTASGQTATLTVTISGI